MPEERAQECACASGSAGCSIEGGTIVFMSDSDYAFIRDRYAHHVLNPNGATKFGMMGISPPMFGAVADLIAASHGLVIEPVAGLHPTYRFVRNRSLPPSR